MEKQAPIHGTPSQEPQPTASVNAELEEFRKVCRKNWARLIKKVYEVDALMDQLEGIQEIVNLYPPEREKDSRPRAMRVLSRMTRLQDQLFRRLKLGRFQVYSNSLAAPGSQLHFSLDRDKPRLDKLDSLFRLYPRCRRVRGL